MVKDNNAFLHTRYADLFEDNEADDPALEKLIADLDIVYAAASRPADLPGKLLVTLESHVQQPNVPSNEQAPIPIATRSTKRSRRYAGYWQQRISTFVAVALVTVVVGSMLLVFSLVRQAGHGRTTTPSASPVVARSTELNRFLTIHMLNTTTGWAQISDRLISAFVVLRTTDGGVHWQDVTPAQFRVHINDNLGRLYVLDATTAWISNVYPLQSQPTTPHGVLFRTTDEGRTWQKIAVPLPDSAKFAISDVNFFTAQIGIITTSRMENNGKQAQSDVWYTNNGGKSWRHIVTPSFVGISYGYITFSDEKTWLFIRDLTWVTSGTINQDSKTLISVTHDAGITWQQSTLPVPGGFSSSIGNIVGKPKFFSPHDGVLAVDFALKGQGDNLLFYITHDGGTTWQPITDKDGHTWALGKNSAYTLGTPVFADIDHWWIYGEVIPYAGKKLPTTNLLMFTSDGGKHWTSLAIQMPGGQKGQSVSPDTLWSTWSNPDFVSPKVGWLKGYYSPFSDVMHQALFKTVDGGHTWSIVHYSIS